MGKKIMFQSNPSDKSFAIVNVVMTVLFILNWITTCIYNATTSVLLASTDECDFVDLEEVKS